ncbi:hypothetical protein [Bdellovibrio svalbardensis]|uniref:FecR protein domain-containing protein n=1 Tax=Bdellovibrio svalbardensis TaxID=2972972 RepID=A0ABT6DKC0_9BACT|nr:hypothetical protein [Bdellovibrio svalbardensis]MDG0817315.1 hypothetical protein [Bdellovibrio svalbardensis]
MFVKSLPSIFSATLMVFGSLVVAGASASAASKYPSIQEVHGQAWLSGKDNKKQTLSLKSPLVERAVIETSEAGTVKVNLDAYRSFTVLENSEVLLPTISFEGGEAPVIILEKGSLRWQQLTEEKPAYNVALRSDLFEFLAPKGDFVFSMNSEKAFAGVKVFKGYMEFSALNGEEVAPVKEGQEAGFQGILEGKEIAYDILLKGKKIPRGHLTPVTAISKKELAAFSDEAQKLQKNAERRKAQEKKAHEEAKRSGAICSAPAAKFNQCVWICLNNPKKEKKDCLLAKEGVSCVRRRCNANGQWAEESAVDAQKSSITCKAQPVVAPCDY